MVKCLAVVFMLCPWLLAAQTVVTGRVVIQDNHPVDGVNVFCPESGKGTSSDSLGYFELDCPIPCRLEFSHVNYNTESFHVTSNTTPFTVVLRNRQTNLEEVVISARAIPGRLYSSKKEIEMIPAILGEQDILKYLATTPGIVTTNAFDPGIYVRGGNSYENCFLTNDMEIANPDHLTGILATFDPFVLSSSTVYKSGFPAAYNGFLSSYINMRPDVGNKEKYQGELSLGMVSSAVKVKGPLYKGHTSFAGSMRASYLNVIAQAYNKAMESSGNPNYMPEYSFQDFTFGFDSKLSPKWQLTAFALFTGDRLEMKLSESIRYRFHWRTNSVNVGTTYAPGRNSLLRIQLGGKSSYSEGEADGSLPMGGGNRHYSAILRLSYQKTFAKKFQLNTGGKFENARFETANRPEGIGDYLVRSSDRRINVGEAYADVSFNVNKNITVSGGANYQYYSGSSKIHALAPRAKVSFSSGGFSAWADYSQTNQYLALYPYFAIKTPVDIWYPLSKGMKPATCHQYSIGLGHDYKSLISLYLGVFYKDMRHLKDFSSGMSTRYTTLTDQMIEGKGYAKGLEAHFSIHTAKLNFRANYTLSESKRKFPEINEGRAFNPPYDVKHNFVVNGSYDVTPRLTANALWSYASGVYTTFPVGIAFAHDLAGSEKPPIMVPVYKDRYNYRLPANHRLDLNLDYHIPFKNFVMTLSAGAYNVYNHANPSFIYFQPVQESRGVTIKPQSKMLLPFIPYISLRLKL